MENLTMESLQKQINELKSEVKALNGNTISRVIPAGLHVGDTFELAGLTWKILDITENGYVCLADRLEKEMRFDKECNNWETCDLREWLNTIFYNQLAEIVGKENIIPFKRNLLSLDGQTEYGICEDFISMFTVDEFRKYRVLIPNESYVTWTITADSTKCNGNTTWVCVVSPSGYVDYYNYYDGLGVRPFCIFSSEIFESEE